MDLSKLEKESNEEIKRITSAFESTHEDAVAGTARKAIDQALLQMFGGVKSAEQSKKLIIAEVKKVIQKFNDDLGKEIDAELKKSRETMLADLKKELDEQRKGVMNEIRNL